MTGDVGIIALYHDQDPDRPNEPGIFKALAGVLEALIKLKGREHTADLFEEIADGIRKGEDWTYVEPDKPAAVH